MHLNQGVEVGKYIRIDTGEMALNSHLVITSVCKEEKLETEKKHYAILGGVLKNRGVDSFLIVRKNESNYTVGLMFKKLTEQTVKVINTTAFSEEFYIDHARASKAIRIRITGEQPLGIEKLPKQDGGQKMKFNALETTFFFKKDFTEIELPHYVQQWECYDIGKEELVQITPSAFIVDEDIIVAHSNKLCTKFIVHTCIFSKNKSVLTETIRSFEEVSELPVELQQSFAHFELILKESV